MASHHIQLWIKSYGQKSEPISFFSIVFKAIWALLNCVYFQTIVNSLIWHMSSLSLRPRPKVINKYKMRCHENVTRFGWDLVGSQWIWDWKNEGGWGLRGMEISSELGFGRFVFIKFQSPKLPRNSHPSVVDARDLLQTTYLLGLSWFWFEWHWVG